MTREEAVKIFEEAYAAGLKAGKTVEPRPMIVTTHLNPLDDGSPAVQRWYEKEGVCGFAWVNLPFRCESVKQFCKHIESAQEAGAILPHEDVLKYHGNEGKGYPAHWSLWVGEFNQSMARKAAFANAFGEVLGRYGIENVAGFRMD
jgi:hypothetical protein